MREVAEGVADSLGFSLVDEAIVMRAAAEAGVEPQVVADVETAPVVHGPVLGRVRLERGRRRVRLRRRRWLPRTHEGVPMSRGAARPDPAAIEETADRGNAVIVAHAASHALAVAGRRPARPRHRLARDPVRPARGRAGAEREGRRARVDDGDANRVDYLRRFYGEKAELPTHYDLVVNTDRLSADDAVELVVLAAGR